MSILDGQDPGQNRSSLGKIFVPLLIGVIIIVVGALAFIKTRPETRPQATPATTNETAATPAPANTPAPKPTPSQSPKAKR